MSALDFKLFARDKLVLIGVLNRLTQGELAVLTWLTVLDGHKLKDRTQLWDRFAHPKDDSHYWRDREKFGPMLPFTRQGCLKACEALVARGWAEFVNAEYSSYRAGIRLLPIVIHAAAPSWLNHYLAFGAQTDVVVAGNDNGGSVSARSQEVATPVSIPAAAETTTAVARGPSAARNRRLQSPAGKAKPRAKAAKAAKSARFVMPTIFVKCERGPLWVASIAGVDWPSPSKQSWRASSLISRRAAIKSIARRFIKAKGLDPEDFALVIPDQSSLPNRGYEVRAKAAP